MFTTSRVIAAAIVSAATFFVPVQSAAADPDTDSDTGTAVVVTGDEYFVSTGGVTVRHNPSRHSAVVEIAHRGDVLTVDRTQVAGLDAGPPGAGRWLETTNRRTGVHGYIPQDHPATEPTAVTPQTTEPDATTPTVAQPDTTKPAGGTSAITRPETDTPGIPRAQDLPPPTPDQPQP